MAKRKFYIIGHNPNTISDASDFLSCGANALEPDIQYAENDPNGLFYYVSEDFPFPGWYPHDPPHSLQTYLEGLRGYLRSAEGAGKLALIAFDMKSAPKSGQPSSFNINDFLACVDQHFTSTPEGAEVAILVTVPDADKSAFLANWNGQRTRVGIGIDSEDNPQTVIQALSAHAGRFSYGNGVSIGCDPDLYFWMSEAKALQMRDAGQTLRLVYPWTLAGADTLRDYLDLHVDGAIVDLASVTVVRSLLNEPRFATLYEPAASGANPFSDPLPACWVLTIRTRDVPEAGTNAAIIITLTGVLGQVSTVVQSSYEGMMERASMNHATIEGADIGQIQSITLALAGGGLWSGWLPEQITVERCGMASVQFSFGVDDWVYVDKPLTRLFV